MVKETKFSLISSAEKAKAVGKCLEENKANDVVIMELKNVVTDTIVIASASSLRHAKSLADGIRDFTKQENIEFLAMEGYESGQWILLDMNDVVVHIFQKDIRNLYNMENLWHESRPIIESIRQTQYS